MQFNGGMEVLEQWQAAHVANEDVAAGRDQLQRRFEHAQQVIHAGEILDDRVQHDQVERAWFESAEIICSAFQQLDMRRDLSRCRSTYSKAAVEKSVPT